MTHEFKPSRRTVAKGVAWSAPAIAVAAAAPAMAASATGIVGASTYSTTQAGGGKYTAEIFTTGKPSGWNVQPSGATAIVTNVTVWYYLASPNYVFTPVTSNGWTTPVRDTSQPNQVGSTTGLTYYAYKLTYAGDPNNAVASGPVYDFTANAQSIATDPGASYYYQISATVNGKQITNPLRAVCGTKCP